MDDGYGRVAHRLAELLAEQDELRERHADLEREREHLERTLMEFVRHERYMAAQSAADTARLELRDEQAMDLELEDTVRFRVPDYVGETTRRVVSTGVLTMLSQRVECPPNCWLAAPHRHFADGQVAYY